MRQVAGQSELNTFCKLRNGQFIGLAWLVLLAALFPQICLAQSGPQPVDFHAEPLLIATSAGEVSFQIEVAKTPAQQATGLMFRKSMAENSGMLFDFDRTRMVSMWMRNTYLPLDMLFILSDGTIATIAENTEPLSDSIVSSIVPVRYVFEINAFMADELGIAVGDKVQHPVIPSADEPEE